MALNSGTIGKTASGAATGAAVGSIVPGIGTAAGAIGGGAIGFLSDLFGGGDSSNAAVDQAAAAKLAAMRQGALGLAGYRPSLIQAQSQAMENRARAYAPAQNVLAQMYGGHPGAPQFAGQMGVRGAVPATMAARSPYDYQTSHQFGGPVGTSSPMPAAGARQAFDYQPAPKPQPVGIDQARDAQVSYPNAPPIVSSPPPAPVAGGARAGNDPSQWGLPTPYSMIPQLSGGGGGLPMPLSLRRTV